MKKREEVNNSVQMVPKAINPLTPLPLSAFRARSKKAGSLAELLTIVFELRATRDRLRDLRNGKSFKYAVEIMRLENHKHVPRAWPGFSDWELDEFWECLR